MPVSCGSVSETKLKIFFVAAVDTPLRFEVTFFCGAINLVCNQSIDPWINQSSYQEELKQ